MAGPFFFAWVDADETEFSETLHAREDEDVFSFSLTHDEGDFPSLELEVKNPRIGLLAPARKVWAWFSYDDPDVGITPLFFGRLIGIPSNILAEVVTLQFIARPKDYLDQKQSVANGMMVAPYYNSMWLAEDKRTDPDAILEGYSRLWHIDRTSLVVSTSDILSGEDGLVEWTEDDIFYDSVEISLGQTPLTALTVKAEVGWTQVMSSGTRVTQKVVQAFNGQSIMQNWPKAGANLGGGWECVSSKCVDVRGVENAETSSISMSWENKEKEHMNGDTLSSSLSITQPLPGTPCVRHPQSSSYQPGFVNPYSDPPVNIANTAKSSTAYHLYWTLDTELSIRQNARRGRRERIAFTVVSDFQRILSDVTDASDVEEISLSSNALPDSGATTFFATDGGRLSMQYLLAIARAKLLFRCRAVEIKLECPFSKVRDLSLRKNALVHDHRIPGGQAVGKIVSYGMTLSGDDGKLTGNVTMASSIGYGNSIAPVRGDPTYVEDGYVDDGYQEMDGTLIVLPGSDIGFYDLGPTQSPYDFGQYIQEATWRGDFGFQMSEIGKMIEADRVWDLFGAPGFGKITEASAATAASVKRISEFVKANPVYFSLKLKNLEQSFDIPYVVTVTGLTAPKQIDLEAASNG